ncbi:flavin oxidoreductase [Halioglobus maricola]|uniref:Flavin oxidoreductase n=1 Tax=Halioglobus maricola TaxID=2601894 RepID=A0A5P9NLW7_9GAMM|nr:flavin reductase [Halioglobus maricola]QFU76777.1 flavin oxidoreductase [Halioglobus maricola]
MKLKAEDLAGMETRARAAFVNCLSGFKSANLVGTRNAEGKTNLAIMSSTVHLGSHPPLLGLVVRPGGDERHTLRNILETGVYSLNHVHSDFIAAAHQTAARYPSETSEFDEAGLTPTWEDGFAAPLVLEAKVRLGMELREHMPLEVNNTHLVIGEVVLAEVPEGSQRSDGSLDLVAAGSVALSGLDAYHEGVELKRMAYAKPGMPPRQI